MNGNTIASASAALIGSVDWNKVDAQSIIDAMKKGQIREPLTEWLVRKGWLAETPTIAAHEPEVVIDSTIRVTRSKKSTYPDWVRKILHPELENVGPAQYDVSSINEWFHDGQKNGQWTYGSNVYAKLKENDCELLKTCLGLRDLEEIQKKGIAFFRKYLKSKTVFGWASVVQDRVGRLDRLGVPYLCECGDEVVLRWLWLGNRWDGNCPALRHAR